MGERSPYEESSNWNSKDSRGGGSGDCFEKGDDSNEGNGSEDREKERHRRDVSEEI